LLRGTVVAVGAEERLQELGLELPDAPAPIASYVPVVVTGNLAFASGQVASDEGKPMWTGKLGKELDVDAGAEAARRCALQLLAALKAEIGSLNSIRRIVKLTVFVASADSFTDQPKVANGASDLFVQLFGDAGPHARAAVGVAELPLGGPVEIELIAEIG
jgi:enamine deaminase RidA (YjgF/YER057c/UK114 family)